MSLNTLENFSKYVELLPPTARRRFIASDRVNFRKSSPIRSATMNVINNNTNKIFHDNEQSKETLVFNSTKKNNLVKSLSVTKKSETEEEILPSISNLTLHSSAFPRLRTDELISDAEFVSCQRNKDSEFTF